MHESGEDLYWRLHNLSKTLEGSGLIDESQHPDAYSTILDAMAFVRGQRPVVREPLPPASPCAMTESEYRLFKLGWLEAEAAHGIKGGQHG